LFPMLTSKSMTFAEFEHGLLPRIAVPLLAGLLALAASQNNAAAASRTFVISPSEGYGVQECLSNGKTCGKIVADAWCEAHGHGAAQAYGKAEDITASIPSDSGLTEKPDPKALLVSCGD